MSGYLKIVIGPMFSGKSTELIRFIRKLKVIDTTYLLINNKLDNRYGNNIISTHDKEKESCLSIDTLDEIIKTDEYLNASYILIEEAHFFKDLYDFVILSLSKDKKIIIYGLDGDYKQKPIGDILRLIPHCDDIVKLKSYCKLCNDGTDGNFTIRKSDNTNQLVVGGDDIYSSVCRKHLLS